MAKKVTRPKAKTPKQPLKLRSRTLWLEVLFFVALGVFAFSVVAYIAGNKDIAGDVVRVVPAPDAPAEVIEDAVAILYEAPSVRAQPVTALSPIFTSSVRYWEDELVAWADEYNLDPNALATVMQIESCGDPNAGSWAGATGLFQVMPFHFAEGENMFDPDTNATRGMIYFAQGLEYSGGHVGLALAGYNGGHGLISRPYESWPSETQRYYRWGTGIYREASAGWDSSPTLQSWLDAGGQGLCNKAESALGIAARR